MLQSLVHILNCLDSQGNVKVTIKQLGDGGTLRTLEHLSIIVTKHAAYMASMVPLKFMYIFLLLIIEASK